MKIASAQLKNMYKEYTNFHKKKINVVIKKKNYSGQNHVYRQTDKVIPFKVPPPPPPPQTLSVGS